MSMKKTTTPVTQSTTTTVPVISENTSTIDADLGAIDVAPADSELDTIDKDLQNL